MHFADIFNVFFFQVQFNVIRHLEIIVEVCATHACQNKISETHTHTKSS